MEAAFISGKRAFDKSSCWLTAAFATVGAIAALLVQFPLAMPEKLNTLLISACWLLFVLSTVFVVIAALIHIWQPALFWGCCHAINLFLVSLAISWLGAAPQDVSSIAFSALLGLGLGAVTISVRAQYWKGGPAVLIVIAMVAPVFLSSIIPSIRIYALPILGFLSITIRVAMAIFSRKQSEQAKRAETF